MSEFTDQWLEALTIHVVAIESWVVLPNHYHVVVFTDDVTSVRHAQGKLHGATSFAWNNEEGTRGRKVWCNCLERPLRSEAHYRATLNYVHHNPVKHGYVSRWQDWPWSSAAAYLNKVGPEQAKRNWVEYPILEMGAGWDD
jgi:putative transposase